MLVSCGATGRRLEEKEESEDEENTTLKKVHDRMIIADESDKVDDDYDYDVICD